MKISCYQTQSEDLVKTFCKLTEKCYYSNVNTLIFTENEDYANSLDKSLWTYSKKHFIPHATTNDERPSDQPVFITTKIENPNQSEIIILVTPSKQKILDITAPKSPINFQKIQKIIFLFDDMYKIQLTQIKQILATTKLDINELGFFVKNNKGVWQESNITIN